MSGRSVRNVTIALLTFAAASTVIRSAVPWPTSYGVRAKYEHVRDHHDRYDAIYFGSSLAFRAIIPELVDAHLAKAGEPQSSYNFGVPGSNAFELHYIIDQVLDVAPELKHVYLEHIRWRPRTLDRAEEVTDRSDYWHSFATTLLVCRCAAALDLPRVERAQLIWLHVKRMARKYTNYGQGKTLLAELLDPPDPHAYLSVDETDAQRGFQDPQVLLDTDNVDRENAQERRKIFLETVGEYEASVERAINRGRARPAERMTLDAVARCDVIGATDQARGITGRGKRLTVFVPPTLNRADEAYALRDAGVYPELIALSEPTVYPALFRAQNHFDRAHLNRTGAVLFSRALVDEYLRRQRAGKDD